MDTQGISSEMQLIGRQARAAASVLASATAAQKQAALEAAATAIWSNRAEIITANAEDMTEARAKGLSAPSPPWSRGFARLLRNAIRLAK